jgi:hypothetical protein
MFKLIAMTATIAALLAVAPATASVSATARGPCVGDEPGCFSTIQAALDAAQDGDMIEIAPGSYSGGVIIAKSVSLIGAGANATTISGGGPVVTIGSASASPTVSLAGVTITGGVTRHDPQAPHCGPDVPRCGPGYTDATALGGGIEAFPGTIVTIRDSVVTGNRAVPAMSVPSVKAVCPDGPCPVSFGDAAGIDNWGTMTLIGTTVSDNDAAGVQSNGGGIANEAHASLTLRNSRVTGNTASAVAPYGRFVSGGGIFVDHGGALTVENSAIDDNTASLANSIPHPYPLQDGGTDMANAFGGGVFVADGATASIRNSTLDRNTVTVDSAVGEPFGADAAICSCGSGPLTLENSRLSGNALRVNTLSSADVGPSAGILEIDGDGTITNTHITSNTIAAGSATGDAALLGIVVLLDFAGTTAPTIESSTISDNSVTATATSGSASVQGVALTNAGPLLLRNTQVDRNKGSAVGVSGLAQGGGIWNGELFGATPGTVSLENTHVAANRLTASPGLTVQGGGIFTPGFPLTLDHSVVAHNTPDDCYGC